MRNKCPNCGYQSHGLKITKKMIRDVPTRFDCSYALDCIYEQCKCVKNKQGEYKLRFTPNQLEFIRVCKKYNVPGLILHSWIKNIN